MNYFYSVVSYDQGVPVADIPPLESSLYQNIIMVRPQHMALELEGTPKISNYIHSGPSTGQFLKAITSYENLTGHNYEIQFFQSDPLQSTNESADYGILIDSILADVGNIEPLKDLVPGENFVDTLIIAGSTSEIDGNPPLGVVVPGTFNLTINGVQLNDVGNGIIQGVSNGDTVRAVLNYGDGVLSLSSEMSSLFMSGSVSAQYSYNPLILEEMSSNKFTGKLAPETVYGLSSTSILDLSLIHI